MKSLSEIQAELSEISTNITEYDTELSDYCHEQADGSEHVIYYAMARDLVAATSASELEEAEQTWKDCGGEFEDLQTLHTQLAYWIIHARTQAECIDEINSDLEKLHVHYNTVECEMLKAKDLMNAAEDEDYDERERVFENLEELLYGIEELQDTLEEVV